VPINPRISSAGADAIILQLHAGAVDAHRAVFNRDVQHLHGAVAEEQPGRQVEVVAGEVEPGEKRKKKKILH